MLVVVALSGTSWISFARGARCNLIAAAPSRSSSSPRKGTLVLPFLCWSSCCLFCVCRGRWNRAPKRNGGANGIIANGRGQRRGLSLSLSPPVSEEGGARSERSGSDRGPVWLLVAVVPQSTVVCRRPTACFGGDCD